MKSQQFLDPQRLAPEDRLSLLHFEAWEEEGGRSSSCRTPGA